jgi:hypothetical protein
VVRARWPPRGLIFHSSGAELKLLQKRKERGKKKGKKRRKRREEERGRREGK